MILSVAVHNSIAAALDPSLDILRKEHFRWHLLSTFGYGIRRPSAPYRRAAHDWTCDRAIIELEHDLPFSSADFFLFFLLVVD